MRRFCARVGPTPDRARTEGVVAGSADGGSLRDKGLLVRFHAPRPGPWHIHPPSFWKAARAVELTCVPAFSMGTGSDAPLSARGLSHGFSTSHEWSTECG